MNKKISIVIVVLIVVAAIGGLWALSRRGKTPGGTGGQTPGMTVTENPKPNPAEVKTQEVESTKLPEKFPADFPIEKGAVVLNNYNAENLTQFQATRQFVTKKTLAENLKLYTDYLKKNGWKLNPAVDMTDLKSVSASKNNMAVSVVMSHNTVDGQNTVDISFTYKK